MALGKAMGQFEVTIGGRRVPVELFTVLHEYPVRE